MTTDTDKDWLSRPSGLTSKLRALQTRAGLSGKDVAAAAGWEPSKVSRLINGRQLPSLEDISTFAAVCGGSDADERELVELLVDVKNQLSTFRQRMKEGQAGVQADYSHLVDKVAVIRHFETVFVPGLLQTADYARRILSEMVKLHDLEIDDIDAAVVTRMQRQQFLYDSTKQFEFLITEPVLLWKLCDAEVMRVQLDRLQSVIGLPNVRFGVLELGTPRQWTPQNAFQTYDDLVVVETFVGETRHHGDEAEAYIRAMDWMWSEAATGDAARLVIRQAAERLAP